MIFKSFGKEVHNIQIKDLDHKDRQNFDAVNHLTSDTVINLLVHCGYIGTKVYLTLIRYVRFIFVLRSKTTGTRYWQQWILDNNQYN